jgi:hypothetical protein
MTDEAGRRREMAGNGESGRDRLEAELDNPDLLLARAGGLPGGGQDEDVFLWDHGVRIEPWPEPVNGKELLDELEGLYKRFTVLPMWSAEALALWTPHTYAYHLRDVTTYIGIESPEKRCGKTTLLTVICGLVNRPVVASNISSPAFFRVIEEKAPTLLIDEADTVLHRNKELRGILNSGYARKTAYVIRAARQKARDEVRESGNGRPGKRARRESRLARFSCWCPKAIATIKHLPETLADRCIVIEMQRKNPQEQCERLRNLNGVELRRKCARFAADHAEEIARAQPEIPADLNDRAADIWEPLFVLADIAGGDWPERARRAAVALTAKAQEESPIVSLMLDLLVIFVQQGSESGGVGPRGGKRIFSRDIVADLNRYPNRPWVALRKGKEVTELWLAQQLRPYGLRPKTMWIGDTAAKGYLEDEFLEAVRRYVPRSAAQAFIDDQRAGMKRPEGEVGPRSA